MVKKVKIYTTPFCVYCKMEKGFFEKNNVQYTEYNVASDVKAREEMIGKTGQLGVPVTTIDNEIVIGFDQERLSKLLGVE